MSVLAFVGGQAGLAGLAGHAGLRWAHAEFGGEQVRAGGSRRQGTGVLRGVPVTSVRAARLSMVLAERNAEQALVPALAPRRKKGRLSIEFDAILQDADEAAALKPPLPDADKYRWARGGYSQLERSLAVWSVFGTILFKNQLIGRKWTYIGGYSDEKKSKRLTDLGVYCREQILNLGPTFIKLGQLFSARADILPREIVDELAFLQDKVPAYSFARVKQLIEDELEEPLHILFEYVDPVPLAAASLGQVHRARLHTGDEVVIKVQRPGLKRLFDLDLSALLLVAKYLQNSRKFGGQGKDWVGIYEECAKILNEEIDYYNEAANADRFRELFKDTKWVRIPRVYSEYSTSRVITLQYVPGIKISDIAALDRAGLDKRLIARRTAESYLMQILQFGFFHADSHPGNISVGPGEVLYYYDFGMMGSLNGNVKEALVDMLIAIVDKDAQRVVDLMIQLGALTNVTDRGPIRRAVQYFLDNITSKPLREQTVGAIGDDLYEIARDKPFRIPATFSFVLRAFSILEGVQKTLDPEFKFAEVATPYGLELFDARKRFLSSMSSAADGGGARGLIRRFRNETVRALPQVLSVPTRIDRIDRTLEKLELGDIKLNSRSSETDRLLRTQTELVQNNNVLYVAGVLSLLSTQTYTLSNGDVTMTAIPAAAALILGMYWLKRLDTIQRDPFKRS
ncbi:Uncharacterized protein FVE85_8585 [Porphyridium purpureum]|uniref:ABC1 atypical kinase-like domain-containing protein n=1 Tax=Porphyridium purpureum TaxID=35688 RepID=A0A5J4YQ79_PORPP|nr:Uncharacterized protein FVE85_8585 [Porphyridium purpureum]|eukprot:POR7204..scf296_7